MSAQHSSAESVLPEEGLGRSDVIGLGSGAREAAVLVGVDGVEVRARVHEVEHEPFGRMDPWYSAASFKGRQSGTRLLQKGSVIVHTDTAATAGFGAVIGDRCA